MSRMDPSPSYSAQSYSEDLLPLCFSGGCDSPSIPHGNSQSDSYCKSLDVARTRENSFAGHFANILRNEHPLWRDALAVGKPGVFPDAPRIRPDILIRAPGVQPVVIETEFEPASGVEADAKARLGLVPASASDPIEQVIAVRLPLSLRREQAGLRARIAAADCGYCVNSRGPSAPVRRTASGWLTGSIDDIARCIEHTMVSQRLIDESISILERGGERTTRVAMTMIAYALTSSNRTTFPPSARDELGIPAHCRPPFWTLGAGGGATRGGGRQHPPQPVRPHVPELARRPHVPRDRIHLADKHSFPD